MTDRPILFSAPMIKALLAGTKTQTRRILKPPPERMSNGSWLVRWQVGGGSFHAADATDADLAAEMWEGIRIQAGDRLWVREAWRTFVSLDDTKPRDIWSPGCGRGAGVFYEADEGGSYRTREGEFWPAVREGRAAFGKLRPSMFMPRWASRLMLAVTDVRVQQLQDISEADAIAEGITCENVIIGMACYGGMPSEITADRYYFDGCDDEGFEDGVSAYADLWDSINGAGSWAANPWVVAYSFTVERRNIDAEG